ncbi:right-handed parallel beta-helix repeat-containing protein [Streptomyces sp. M10(2022)]
MATPMLVSGTALIGAVLGVAALPSATTVMLLLLTAVTALFVVPLTVLGAGVTGSAAVVATVLFLVSGLLPRITGQIAVLVPSGPDTGAPVLDSGDVADIVRRGNGLLTFLSVVTGTVLSAALVILTFSRGGAALTLVAVVGIGLLLQAGSVRVLSAVVPQLVPGVLGLLALAVRLPEYLFDSRVAGPLTAFAFGAVLVVCGLFLAFGAALRPVEEERPAWPAGLATMLAVVALPLAAGVFGFFGWLANLGAACDRRSARLQPVRRRPSGAHVLKERAARGARRLGQSPHHRRRGQERGPRCCDHRAGRYVHRKPGAGQGRQPGRQGRRAADRRPRAGRHRLRGPRRAARCHPRRRLTQGSGRAAARRRTGAAGLRDHRRPDRGRRRRGALLSGCSVRRAEGTAVHLSGTSRTTAENLSIGSCTGDGLVVADEARAELTDALVDGATGHGVLLTAGAHATLTRCGIRASGGAAFVADGHASAALRECRLHDTGGQGVWVRGNAGRTAGEESPGREDRASTGSAPRRGRAGRGAAARLRGLPHRGRRRAGGRRQRGAAGRLPRAPHDGRRGPRQGRGHGRVDLRTRRGRREHRPGRQRAGRATAHGCTFARAGANGLYAVDEAEVSLTDCTVRDTAYTAVHLGGSARVRLRDCVVSGSPECGVRVTGRAELLADDCEVTGAVLAGCGSRTATPPCAAAASPAGVTGCGCKPGTGRCWPTATSAARARPASGSAAVPAACWRT